MALMTDDNDNLVRVQPKRRLFLDCEFNGYQGELISLALISSCGDYEFYEEIERQEPATSWVAENVLPLLRKQAIPYATFQDRLRAFLDQFKEVTITADYPDDVRYICESIITGPGEWFEHDGLRFDIDPGLTIEDSAFKHNALSDARALRWSWLTATRR